MIDKALMFTTEELWRLKKRQLLSLCEYWELDGVKMKWTKAEMIDTILEYFKEQEVPPEMSVRVRRIYEQNQQ
jgi:hypothetical protein